LIGYAFFGGTQQLSLSSLLSPRLSASFPLLFLLLSMIMVCQILFRRWALLAAKDASSPLCRGLAALASNSGSAPLALTSWQTSLQTSRAPLRCLNSGKPDPSGSELHSLYLEQMNEINADRDAIFGPSDPALESHDISQLAKTYSEAQAQDIESIDSHSDEPAAAAPPAWNKEEAYAEREALFQFTSEEKSAWANYSTSNPLQMNQHKLHLIKEALAHRERVEHASQSTAAASSRDQSTNSTSQFTHLSAQQNTISMVDVGNKTPTRRIAKARCTVTFPPEVLSAFSTQPQNKDMIGPKGPIFETARLAGIMGAKKTSDLIPLCHPLPLDRVHVEIELVGNQAIVECECWVTHKTGVEMEVSYLIVIECIYNDYL
jgi:cyclic pyranopterin phosphate synthase